MVNGTPGIRASQHGIRAKVYDYLLCAGHGPRICNCSVVPC